MKMIQKNNSQCIYVLLGVFLLSIPNYVSANIFTKTKIQGVEMQYVTYDISSEMYNIKVGYSHAAIPLEDLALKYNGITAINGVFFCPDDYTQCDDFNHTINERFIEGRDLSFYPDSGERGIFGWDVNGFPFLHQTNKIYPEYRDAIYEGLGNFPILLVNGQNSLQRYHDIGLYDSKMKASAPRHFVCSYRDKTKIIFGRSGGTSLDGLAPILAEIGCWDALNLDAGNSSHFIYNNNKLVSGKRNIIDGFIIERVGLNTQVLESKLERVMKLLTLDYKQLSPVIAKKRLSAILPVIVKIRTDIYIENSVDIFDDAENIIGYEIQADEIAILERLYLLNGLERKLRELRSSL